MEDIKEIGNYIIEKLLQWIYVTRNKKSIQKILVTLIAASLFVTGLSLSIYIVEMVVEIVVFNNQLDTNNTNFMSVVAIIICIMVLIFLSNIGVKKCEYSRIILSYFYLNMQRKSEEKQSGMVKWLRIGGIILSSIILLELICKELDRWSIILKLNDSDTIVFGFVIIALCIYIPITEFIFDKIQYYKVQASASLVLFIVMFIAYASSIGSISKNDTSKVLSILIFAIGQIVFIVNAISSYKNMYKIIMEKYKIELEEYLRITDEKYAYKIEQINEGVIEAKRFAEECVELWKMITVKQRIMLVLITSGLIFLFIILFILATKMNAF